MEEGGNRWSKPHVATLSLHSLFELRSLLLNGTVMLDMEASGLEQITDLVLDNMINKNVLSIDVKDKVSFLYIHTYASLARVRSTRRTLYGDTLSGRYVIVSSLLQLELSCSYPIYS